jgi:DNA-binding CsgD family transcriptional regulator
MDRGLLALPQWVGAYAEKAIAARGDSVRVRELLDTGAVPMVIFDDSRRYVEANGAAEVALGISREDLLRLRLDDMTPAHLMPVMRAAWARLMETGVWAGPTKTDRAENGTWLGIVYFSLANLLPSRHLNAFAPMGWPGAHTSAEVLEPPGDTPDLSPRELEILQLAASGRNGPAIAEELVISPATVHTHFQHLYEKLAVTDRASAVAKAMRRGLIS